MSQSAYVTTVRHCMTIAIMLEYCTNLGKRVPEKNIMKKFFGFIFKKIEALWDMINSPHGKRTQTHHRHTTCYTYFVSSLYRKLIRQLALVKHIAATLLVFDHHACWLKHVWNRWRLAVIRLKAPGSICSAGILSTSCSSSEEGETIH